MHLQWFDWFLAGLVPGLLSLIIIPFIIYKLYPPEIKETPNAKECADTELEKMGKITVPEKVMIGILCFA